jgi:hypothetical protein
MDLALTRRKIAAAFTVGLAAITAVGITSPAAEGQKGSCSPLDLAFVVDTTGSMGGALDNIKKGLNNIVGEATTVSGGNVRYGVVSFPGEEVIVNTPFADGNESAAKTAINGLSPGGGGSEPEASDEAMNTVINGLKASDRPAGQQTGDFQPPYRSGAEKLAVLITDAHPGGFDDAFTAADTAHVKSLAAQAKAKGIRITAVYVPTSGVDPEIKGIMQDWASGSGGEYRQTKSDGTGASAAIRASIASCGGKTTKKKRLRIRGRPHVIRAGTSRCITFRVRSGRKAVKGAKVRFAGKSHKTNKKGRATFCVKFKKTGRKGVRVTKKGYVAGRTSVFVAAAPRFTG